MMRTVAAIFANSILDAAMILAHAYNAKGDPKGTAR